MNRKYKMLISDTFVFALGSLGSKLILFLLVPLYTNYLTKAEYGTADLISTFSQLLIPIASLSINSSIIRFALKKGEKPENVIRAAFSIFIYTFIICAVMIPALNLYNAISAWRFYLVVYIILSSFSECGKSYLKAKNKNKTYAIISIIQTLTLAITNILLLTCLHTGISGYLLANIIAVGITGLLSFVLSGAIKDIFIAEFDKKLLKRMLIYSAPLILNNMSWWVVHSSDKLMIELMIDASALGIYAAATKIPSLINVLISIFNQAWGLSSIREIESDKDMHFLSSVFSVFTLLTFCSGVFIIAIIKPFMSIYVGPEFQEAWRFTPLLLVAAVFYSISTFYGSLYSAIDKTFINMITTVLCAIVNVVVNYIFIRKLGVIGAVIGTVVSYFVIAFVRMINMRHYLSICIDKNRLIANSIILITEGILVTLDYNYIIISVFCCIAFIAINYRTIKYTVGSLLAGLVKDP